MILPFSTQINGCKTYFIEKIWESFEIDLVKSYSKEYLHYQQAHLDRFGFYWDGTGHMEHEPVHPKPHTLRVDTHNRWKPGMLIHFVINNRSKNQFQFAPVVPCKSTQRVEIGISPMGNPFIFIEGKELPDGKVSDLALNDGFNSAENFFEYFKAGFNGKIIHWTDLKY